MGFRLFRAALESMRSVAPSSVLAVANAMAWLIDVASTQCGRVERDQSRTIIHVFGCCK